MDKLELPKVPYLAKGNVIPPKMMASILETEAKKRKEKREWALSVIGAVCGIIGTLTGVVGLIIAILK